SFWEVMSNYTYNYHKDRLEKNRGVAKLSEQEELQLEFLVAGVIALVKNYLSRSTEDLNTEPYVAVVCSMFPETFQ
ncbi:MAG: hypothetical protein IKF42_06265, partial [Mogibacterium sp.]|nr:hypothetical protein [Mogibacterium sp.]